VSVREKDLVIEKGDISVDVRTEFDIEVQTNKNVVNEYF